ncbi:MAG: hypothetical protein Q9161_008344 [Pseudevernia consocians]
MDLTIDELISHPSISSEPFNIRTASGDKEPISLAGLSNQSTYPKTYHCFKLFLEPEGTKVIYDSPFEANVEHQTILESVLASLSDAQFDALVKILACSLAPRHRISLGICAMLPQDLEALQKSEADRVELRIIDPAVQKASPPANHFLHPHSRCELAYDPEIIRIHNQSSGMDPFNIEVLRRFANLWELNSRKLVLECMGKLPLIFESVDAFTLDLRKTYGPDDVFLPTRELLKEVGKYRNATPACFKVMIPRDAQANFVAQNITG